MSQGGFSWDLGAIPLKHNHQGRKCPYSQSLWEGMSLTLMDTREQAELDSSQKNTFYRLRKTQGAHHFLLINISQLKPLSTFPVVHFYG